MHTHTLTTPVLLKSIEGTGRISGYASVFNYRDNHGDIVEKGSFAASLKAMNQTNTFPKMLWQHQSDTPIGRWDTMREDDHGLYVEGTLLLSLNKGRDVYEMIKNNMIDGLSIGCHVVESVKSHDRDARLLTKIDLLEVSLVTFAANQQAKILSVKSYHTYQQQLLNAIHYAKNILKGPLCV